MSAHPEAMPETEDPPKPIVCPQCGDDIVQPDLIQGVQADICDTCKRVNAAEAKVKTVTVYVRNGSVQSIDGAIPDDVRIVVVDYDCDALDEGHESEDDDGESCHKWTEHEAEIVSEALRGP